MPCWVTELADFVREQDKVRQAFLTDGAHFLSRALQKVAGRNAAARGENAGGKRLFNKVRELLLADFACRLQPE